jgi:hypothetical protein
MARRIAGLGRVTVSDRRSTTTGSPLRAAPVAADLVVHW